MHGGVTCWGPTMWLSLLTSRVRVALGVEEVNHTLGHVIVGPQEGCIPGGLHACGFTITIAVVCWSCGLVRATSKAPSRHGKGSCFQQRPRKGPRASLRRA